MNGQDFILKFNELLDMTKQAYEDFAQHTEAAIAAQRPMMLAIDEENIDADDFKLDAALFKAAPVVAVPQHSEFFPLQESGHRFLVAEDGFYIEARRPWLHFIHRLAENNTVRIPYGPIKPKVELAFGTLGSALAQMREFAGIARQAAPIEAAASLLWNHETKDWSIKQPETIGATPSSIRYKHVDIGENENAVIDLHSHGNSTAFFSPTDNQDDAGTVKIAGVFGNLDQALPTVAFRLCVLGLYLPIQVPAEKIFG